jgi:quercetin dioxygenase-like cupin family protein
MKSFLYALPLLGAATLAAQSDGFQARRLAPVELEWTVGGTGIGRALIAGNSAEPGMYAYRVRFPEGTRIEPHYHPDDRVVTVISGTLLMGYGEVFDEGTMEALPGGSLWTEPGGQPHFVWAREGEVVIQVIGYGPSDTTQVAQ